MFDIGFYEMVIVGVVALIVVGPKDLPKMFRTVGQYVGKARGMARQFQNAMNDAARQSELQDVKKAMDGVSQGVKAATDPLGQATKSARAYANSMMTEPDPIAEEEAAKRAEAAAAKSAATEPHFDEMPDPEPAAEPVPAEPKK
ncbi:Sec-independent protein translocase protein TatB [Pontivivens ytuae]|uniref:Sec-independent protein translocase protein TatB n=1 Tax=Pontivivens ytuae TaxID=2789856 RepID=A0A7S9LS95_9RHOB|nr:Sec-independent protein translocase protein TatB [Pontivivens ytuae]QPH54376.1 twin-arginine translocase subunit TatB [Pontivivens ytuae]